MLAMPTPTPSTDPPVPTVATPGALLLQVPPGVPSDSAVEEPTHIVTGVPGVIAAGSAFTVTVAREVQVPMA